ncbi:MAG: polynucleotide kinase-phosphatase, partial [Acidimicrobiales bacterium]
GPSHPEGRTAVFVGDLVDRGPGVVETVELVMAMVSAGNALCVAGNHEAKLVRALKGREVQATHGLTESLEQLAGRSEGRRAEITDFLDGLISHYVLDDGQLVVCHAGLPERFHNRSSGRVRSFCLYGETTGETDEFGLPVRYQWAADYRGDAAVVYGHTSVPSPEWINNTICLDTGAVFGGSLSALRWPERELVSVDAAAQYYQPIKPLVAERNDPLLLELSDVTGRRHIETGLMGRLAIAEERNAAALELTSRFTVDPRWLAYLPPTMAPVATAADGPLLERPAEAFSYYAGQGLTEVVCQEKHMGSRAVVIVARNPDVLVDRFGIDRSTAGAGSDEAESAGMIITRTGRQFFDDEALGRRVVARLAGALDKADAWSRHGTDWFILDGELLPWSAKAGPLIRRTYASVAAAGRLWAPATIEALKAASDRGVDGLDEVLAMTEQKGEAIDAFRTAYRHYVTPDDGLRGTSFAPFTILATEEAVTARKDNRWQLAECDRLVEADPEFVRRTDRREVDLSDEASQAEATAWWTELTAGDGEGMVVKPIEAVGRGPKGLIQPGVKCRGFEYLRIVYGPDYPLEANLERLRNRSLNRKRSLALREFALGVEALDRFVAGDPLWRIHECVFSILALESEPIDPRL